jgi:hypothetical protein
MQLEKPAAMGSYEFHQPNTFVPINPALGRSFPLFPTAQPAQIRFHVVALMPAGRGSTESDRFIKESPEWGLKTRTESWSSMRERTQVKRFQQRNKV